MDLTARFRHAIVKLPLHGNAKRVDQARRHGRTTRLLMRLTRRPRLFAIPWELEAPAGVVSALRRTAAKVTA
jgi:hypothetical protein